MLSAIVEVGRSVGIVESAIVIYVGKVCVCHYMNYWISNNLFFCC